MRKTLLLTVSVFLAFLFITFGYAELSDILSVEGEVSFDGSEQYEIQITEASFDSSNAADVSLNSISFHGLILNSSITLGEQNSVLLLRITVKNNTADKTFSYSKIIKNSALENGYTNENIVAETYESYPGNKMQSLFYEIEPQQSKTFFLVFSYKDGNVAAQKDLSSVLTIKFIEKLAVLPGETTLPPATTASSTAPVTPPGGSTAPGETTAPPASSSSSSSTPPPSQTTAPGGNIPGSENGTNFNRVITYMIEEETAYGFNYTDKPAQSILGALANYDIIYCRRNNYGSSKLPQLLEALNNNASTENILFIARRLDGNANNIQSINNVEVLLYYETDIDNYEPGTLVNIVVFKQFLTKDSSGKWDVNGAYQGYAPIKPMPFQNNGGNVYSIDPDEWTPGAIPMLTE